MCTFIREIVDNSVNNSHFYIIFFSWYIYIYCDSKIVSSICIFF